MMRHALSIFMSLWLGLAIGNFLADQATLRDCATNGAAEMEGGGLIKCEVVKAQD